MAPRELPECPCGCGVRGALTKKRCPTWGRYVANEHLAGCPVCGDGGGYFWGHSRGCTCRPCLGKRNRRRGQKSQSEGYKKLGGKARRSPTQEEWAETLNVPVKIENKRGYSGSTATFRAFVAGAFFRKALGQAQRSIPIGVQAYPGVRLDLGRGQDYLVVALSPARMPRYVNGGD